MAKISYKKNVNIGRVVAKLITTILALYVGGFILNEFGNVMVNTSSPFYKGLSLIGWTVTTQDALNATVYKMCDGTQNTHIVNTTTAYPNCLTATSGAGVLAVVGIIGIASIVLEFVQFKM